LFVNNDCFTIVHSLTRRFIYKERLFYISGLPGMVNALSGQVLELGVSAKQIHIDSFTGYE